MNLLVTCDTRGNEVVLRVRPAVTAIDNVVDLQIGPGAAELAAPVVAFENSESQAGGFAAPLRACRG